MGKENRPQIPPNYLNNFKKQAYTITGDLHMIVNVTDFKKIIKKIIILISSIILIIIGLKLASFYMPFLIAFVLYLLIEPIIRFFMKKLNLKRKTSALLILFFVLALIIGLLVWGIVTLISESSNLLNNLNEYVNIIYSFIQEKTSSFNFSKIQLSTELNEILNNSTQNLLTHVSEIVKNFLTGVLNKLTSLPTIGFYIVITVMSLYFISTDKIYMIDQLEHHLPRKWVRKIALHVNGIAHSLGAYLKAQVLLILVSFIISLVGLYIYSLVGFDIKYPLLAALGIGFIDALPILGAGTIMIPWAIIAACKGNLNLGIAILVLWLIMTVVRQLIEPKIVSGQIGIHPIFTLVAMYTGFKFCGVWGLFVGPIILIILKNIFESRIDKGLVKSIIE